MKMGVKKYLCVWICFLSLCGANEETLPKQEGGQILEWNTWQKEEKITPRKDTPTWIYGLSFSYLLDNLEASFPLWDTRTIFGVSAFPEVGLEHDNWRLRLGGYGIMNMGERLVAQNTGLSLYYDIASHGFSGYFGIFPRKVCVGGGAYPRMYYRRDFMFYNPMIHGMALQYDKQGLVAEFIFDWYGGDVKKRDDEFLAQGFVRKSFWGDNIYLGGSFLLFHTKNSTLLNPNTTIYDVWLLDRLHYHAFLGVDIEKNMLPAFDKFDFTLGLLGSHERKRLQAGLEPFVTSLGVQAELKMQYNGFGIEQMLYYGQKHFAYFNDYAQSVYWGVPFYHSRFYDRLEMYWEYANTHYTTRLSGIVHITEEIVANQIMFYITLDTHKLLNALR